MTDTNLDIVKRLRSLNEGNRWPMMDEAADEIERLRASLREWQTLAWTHANALRRLEDGK